MPSREQIAAALKYVGDKANLRQRFERATSLDPQEQDMADIAVETGASFIPGVGQALAARDVERARRANDPAGMAMASMGAIPGGRLAGLLKRYDPVMQQLDVYHGTPHKFPVTEANPLGEFDASKIGTGEGAQAYGKGIYFTESPDVAKGYQPRDPKAEAKLLNLYKQAETRQNYNAMEVLEAAMLHRTADELREQFPRQKGLVGRIAKIQEQSPSSLYKADLPDEMIDQMLDYDKPINEHSQGVLDALEKAGINTQSAMRAGQMIEGQEAHLAKFGIPGMIYREGRGKGPRNFVVFPGEEKKVRILERK